MRTEGETQSNLRVTVSKVCEGSKTFTCYRYSLLQETLQVKKEPLNCYPAVRAGCLKEEATALGSCFAFIFFPMRTHMIWFLFQKFTDCNDMLLPSMNNYTHIYIYILQSHSLTKLETSVFLSVYDSGNESLLCTSSNVNKYSSLCF